MEILATLKKKANWAVTKNHQGLIKTGNAGGKTPKEIDIPIFRLRLKYNSYSHNASSITFLFVGDAAESLMSVLRGTGRTLYHMSEQDGLSILGQLARRDTSFLTLHEDGWFEGVFTYKKTGRHVYMIPFNEVISENNKNIILTIKGENDEVDI